MTWHATVMSMSYADIAGIQEHTHKHVRCVMCGSAGSVCVCVCVCLHTYQGFGEEVEALGL